MSEREPYKRQGDDMVREFARQRGAAPTDAAMEGRA